MFRCGPKTLMAHIFEMAEGHNVRSYTVVAYDI